MSGLEASGEFWDITKLVPKFKYILCSFYYLKDDIFQEIKRKSDLLIIDSGAHSFQKGKKVDWVEYTKKYADWIEKNDSPQIVGYFEMDVDNLIGYKKVLELRKILESKSDKIIPVWHKNRGIEDFKKMCRDYSGKVIAITGFKNEDIKDEQYLMFMKYAKKPFVNQLALMLIGMIRMADILFPYMKMILYDLKSIRLLTRGVL